MILFDQETSRSYSFKFIAVCKKYAGGINSIKPEVIIPKKEIGSNFDLN